MLQINQLYPLPNMTKSFSPLIVRSDPSELYNIIVVVRLTILIGAVRVS